MQASKCGAQTVLWVPVHALGVVVEDRVAHGWSARNAPRIPIDLVGYRDSGPFGGPLYNSDSTASRILSIHQYRGY